jgi:hypothetical protein
VQGGHKKALSFTHNYDSVSKGLSPNTFFCSLQNTRHKGPPLVLDQIRELLPIIPDIALAGEISERGINFPVTEAIISNLNQAGAGPRTIQVLRSYKYNRLPSVVFNYSQLEVYQGDAIKIYANVSDPDGDELLYFWAASAGEIQGEGPISILDTSKLYPSDKAVQVSVSLTVIDRKGGSDSYSKSVTVQSRTTTTKPHGAATEFQRLQSQIKNSQQAIVDGKYIVVDIRREPSEVNDDSGFIEVTLDVSGPAATISSLTGSLPGKPCRVDVVARDNLAEYSFKEPPGSFNAWSGLAVRVRPKDMRRAIRFGIYWQILGYVVKR